MLTGLWMGGGVGWWFSGFFVVGTHSGCLYEAIWGSGHSMCFSWGMRRIVLCMPPYLEQWLMCKLTWEWQWSVHYFYHNLSRQLLVYIYLYIYMYVCMYICVFFVFFSTSFPLSGLVAPNIPSCTVLLWYLLWNFNHLITTDYMNLTL